MKQPLRYAESCTRTAPDVRQSPGKAKAKEEWEKAWDEWNSLIAEASQEKGQYVIQEHHRDEPYFDPGSVTLALEPIASGMA